MSRVEQFKVSSSGQLSLPAAVRRRWKMTGGGQVDVIDLGFGVLTVPAGHAGRLLDAVLPAEVHYRAVADETDPDLWYARLCKSAAGHKGGALLGSWSEPERDVVIAYSTVWDRLFGTLASTNDAARERPVMVSGNEV